jgi:translation elongation factor EF-G
MDILQPVISLAIVPKTKVDQEKLGLALPQLMAEDPTFRINIDQLSGKTVITGMSELHVEIIVDRLRREFNVEGALGKLQVAYKETLTRPADGEGRYVRQTGGHGQYGHVKIHLYPQSHDDRGGRQIVSARVPLSEMLGYATDLRSRSQGRATYSMYFDRYQHLRSGPDLDDEDRNSPVCVPRNPTLKGNESAVALPEPDDDNLEA